MAFLLVFAGLFASCANITKLCRMLVPRVNDWQQPYEPGCRWLAEENNFVFTV
jgi:hypothetical protein